jgi:hypothetical protein
LEVQQDQSGSTAVRDANPLYLIARVHDLAAWFNQKPHSIGDNLPGLVVWKATMGQRSLCPAGVDETDASILVAHVGCGRFYDATIYVSVESRPLAVLIE